VALADIKPAIFTTWKFFAGKTGTNQRTAKKRNALPPAMV